MNTHSNANTRSPTHTHAGEVALADWLTEGANQALRFLPPCVWFCGRSGAFGSTAVPVCWTLCGSSALRFKNRPRRFSLNGSTIRID